MRAARRRPACSDGPVSECSGGFDSVNPRATGRLLGRTYRDSVQLNVSEQEKLRFTDKKEIEP